MFFHHLSKYTVFCRFTVIRCGGIVTYLLVVSSAMLVITPVRRGGSAVQVYRVQFIRAVLVRKLDMFQNVLAADYPLYP